MPLFDNYPFLLPASVLFLSEATKFFVERLRTGYWQAPFQAGGMPSSHSSFVMSLLVLVGFKIGIESMEFAMASVFAGIVWYDALNVRNIVGQQAKALNLLQTLYQFSERVGHSFIEVMGGIAFGGLVTWLLL